MSEIVTVWLDLATRLFQAHGADASGRAMLHKKLRRDQVLASFSQLPRWAFNYRSLLRVCAIGPEFSPVKHQLLLPPRLAFRCAPWLQASIGGALSSESSLQVFPVSTASSCGSQPSREIASPHVQHMWRRLRRQFDSRLFALDPIS